MLQLPFAPLARIDCGRFRFECLVMFSQMIDDPCDLMRGRYDGLLWAKPRPHRATIRPEGRVGPGGLAKGLGGPIDHFQRSGTQPTAPQDVVVRGESQP